MAPRPSLYDILGVKQDASPEAVRKAYKRKVLQTHPDKLPPHITQVQKKYAEDRFREVCTAFNILNDPAKRRVYDNGLNYTRGQAHHEDLQAKLAHARNEWEKQWAQRHEDRMKAKREEQRAAAQQRFEANTRANQQKYEDNVRVAEMTYREKVWTLEEQMRLSRETMLQHKLEGRLQDDPDAAEIYALADDMLRDMRKNNPHWEVRRREAERRRATRGNSQESVRSDT